jgi:hypothetical protein
VIGDALGPLLGSAGLAAGLRFGLVASALGVVVALARRGGRPLAIAGLLFAAAAAAALQRTLGVPAGLALGLLVLAGAGALRGHGHRAAGPLAWLLAVLGAWLLVARSGLALEQWARLLVGVAIVLGGWLVADFDAKWRRWGLGPVLLAVSVAGVYATVPDTERALTALGAALPLALLGWPWPLSALGPAGAYAATGVLLWVMAAGSDGRGSAVVGGVACLGLLAVEPLARLLDPGRGSALQWLPRGRWGWGAAAVPHLGLVFVSARVAGVRPSALAAVAIVLVELCAAVPLALLASAGRRARRRRHSP